MHRTVRQVHNPRTFSFLKEKAMRITILHLIARLLGVTIKVDGVPFGSTRLGGISGAGTGQTP